MGKFGVETLEMAEEIRRNNYEAILENIEKEIKYLRARINELENDLLNVQYRLGDHIRGEDDG